MIAVLWHNAIGLRRSDAYPPDELDPERFGVAAPWTIISRWSEPDPQARQPSLSRNGPYPWSKNRGRAERQLVINRPITDSFRDLSEQLDDVVALTAHECLDNLS